MFVSPPSRGRESHLRRQSWTRFFSAKQTVTMDAFDAFDAAAGDLMLSQGVKASELHKRLRNITEAASKDLPPLQVLYCASYGGYGYSNAFESFIGTKQAVPDSLATRCALQSVSNSEWYPGRVRDVQWIAPFGQHVMETWPGIAKLVKAYMRNDLGHRMGDIQEIASKGERLLKIPKIRDSIAAETGKTDGETEWSKWCLHEKEDYGVYAPSALEAMCTALDAEQNELTLAIQEKRDAVLMHMTEAQYEAMLQSLGTKFSEEEVEAAKAWYVRKSTKQLSFTDAITNHGELHYAVWQYQRIFKEKAMRFLLLHPEHTERLASEGNNVDCTHQLGLCAASSEFCRLRIAEVPRLAEWTVGEYDGLESIDLA